MINLMYCVHRDDGLNVSTEVLDGFELVEASSHLIDNSTRRNELVRGDEDYTGQIRRSG